MLACASMGAIWTCCAPEMGVTGVVDRLSQVEPAVLLSVDGYRYGSRAVDRRAEAESVRGQLPSVRKAVWLPYLETGVGRHQGGLIGPILSPLQAPSTSPPSISTTRCTSFSPRAPPANQSQSCMAMVASSSNMPRRSGFISTSGRATGSFGSARRGG